MKKLLVLLIIVLCLIGEIRCIYKAFTCDWNPVGSSEIIYTASSLTGFGFVVGWFDIKDN